MVGVGARLSAGPYGYERLKRGAATQRALRHRGRCSIGARARLLEAELLPAHHDEGRVAARRRPSGLPILDAAVHAPVQGTQGAAGGRAVGAEEDLQRRGEGGGGEGAAWGGRDDAGLRAQQVADGVNLRDGDALRGRIAKEISGKVLFFKLTGVETRSASFSLSVVKIVQSTF